MNESALQAALRLEANSYSSVCDEGGLDYEFASDVDRVAVAFIALYTANQELLKQLHDLSRDIKALNYIAEKR